jgi:hypothetical protein
MQPPTMIYPGKTVDGRQFYDLREYSAHVDLRSGSDLLVICFANAPMPRHTLNPDAFWGASFMAGRGLDHICLSGRSETWFRSDIVDGFVRAMTSGLTHRRILTYGVSKGGTAALWHAGAARATDVFACVPQVLPDGRALARGDDRWASAAFHQWPEAVLQQDLQDVARITVLTDRCNAFEAAYLEDLQNLYRGDLRAIDLRYAGHDGAAMLGRQHALSQLFDMVASDRIDRQALRELTECRKAEPGYYLNVLAKARVARSPYLSALVKGAAAARGIEPSSVRMDSGYRKLAKLGRY